MLKYVQVQCALVENVYKAPYIMNVKEEVPGMSNNFFLGGGGGVRLFFLLHNNLEIISFHWVYGHWDDTTEMTSCWEDIPLRPHPLAMG